MRIFLEVCRTMNVTRAAENLYMTQPAVSRAIREIEQTYSIRLFERLNQRLYLTDSGRRMHAYAVHIVDTFDRMERELSDGDERGVLRVGASITLGNYELPAVARRMKKNARASVYRRPSPTSIRSKTCCWIIGLTRP